MFISLWVFVVSIKWTLVFGFKNNWWWKSEFVADGPHKSKGFVQMWASWLRMRALASRLTDESGFPPISGLWNPEIGRDVRACPPSGPEGAATSTGQLESWEMVFVTNNWNRVPPAMYWARDTSLSQLEKNLPSVMTCSAPNVSWPLLRVTKWLLIYKKQKYC